MVKDATFWKTRHACTAAAFVAVVVPIHCDYVGVRNIGSVPLTMRSDPDDPDTEDTLDVAGQTTVTSPFGWDGSARRTRFVVGDVFCYVQGQGGDGLALCTWVK